MQLKSILASIFITSSTVMGLDSQDANIRDAAIRAFIADLQSGKELFVLESPLPDCVKNVDFSPVRAAEEAKWYYSDDSPIDVSLYAPHYEGIIFSKRKIKGEVPFRQISQYIDIMQTHKPVKFVVISSNNLSGTISREIGNWGAIPEINLSFNKFSGAIPPEIGNLKKLKILRFNNNQFSGALPQEIGDLDSLEELNFANYCKDVVPRKSSNAFTSFDGRRFDPEKGKRDQQGNRVIEICAHFTPLQNFFVGEGVLYKIQNLHNFRENALVTFDPEFFQNIQDLDRLRGVLGAWVLCSNPNNPVLDISFYNKFDGPSTYSDFLTSLGVGTGTVIKKDRNNNLSVEGLGEQTVQGESFLELLIRAQRGDFAPSRRAKNPNNRIEISQELL